MPEVTVGHQAPFERARELLNSGAGALVLLVGPAGIGKTTLARRLSATSSAPVAWAVGGRADAPPFWPWTQLFREVGVGESALLPRLLDSSTDLAAPVDARERFAVFDEVAARLTVIGPRLLVIDDLHQADPASLLLLAHLGPVLPLTKTVVIATVRDDIPSLPEPWPTVWPELVRNSALIPVGPLAVEDVLALLKASTQPADRAVAERIFGRTAGNAFFISQLVRSPAPGDALPEGARAVVTARVAERSVAARAVLGAASVLGTRFSTDLVQVVVGEHAADLDAALDEAAGAGLVVFEAQRQYAFAHEIVRDAIHDALPRAHREHWHAAIADHLIVAGADVVDIAHHLRTAGAMRTADAAAWSDRAGRQSMAQMAYEDAARQYNAAIALLAPSETGELQLRLGSAYAASGRTVDARAAYVAAARLARDASDGSLLARAALGLGAGPAALEISLNDRDQVEALRDSLDLLGEDDTRLRALVLSRLSVAVTFSASVEDRRELASQALAAARASGDEAALGTALAAYCDVIAGPDSCRERLALTTEIVDAAMRARDPMLELLGRRQRLVARLELGDVVGAEDEVRAFDTVARALHQPACAWYVPLWRAMFAAARGDMATCNDLLADTYAIGQQVGSTNAIMLAHTLSWVAASEAAAMPQLEEVVRTLGEMTDPGPWVAVALGLAAMQIGRVRDAEVQARTFTSVLPTLPRDSEWLPSMTQAAEVLGTIGPREAAQWLYDELLPYADLFVVEGIGAGLRGSVERFLALLAARLGNRPAARAHFEAALDRNRLIGSSLLVARTLRDYGTTFEDETILGESRALYRELGIEATPPAAPTRAGAFRRSGDGWEISFGGKAVVVRDSKGLRDMAVLIRRPGHPVAAIELAADSVPAQGDLGEVIDAQARETYRRRLRDLDEAIEDAAGDRAESLRDERDALVAQLASAYGLGGRPRRAGSPVERARTTVTARVRDSIKKLEPLHPELARHLRHSIRTGTLCVYEPESPVDWTF